MSLWKSNLSLTALFVLVICASAGAQPATQPAADIDIGAPTKDLPNLVTPLMEGGVLKDNHHGPTLGVQEFFYNPDTHEVGLVKNSPAGQQPYGNTEIDAAYFAQDLTVFNYLTDKRTHIGNITLACANKKLFITSNYVVCIMQDDPPKIDPSAYFADVQFVKGAASNGPGTTVTFHRNDDPPSPVADTSFSKINRKTDVITWTVVSGGSVAIVQSGSFGFPVVANAPGLVKYVINLP